LALAVSGNIKITLLENTSNSTFPNSEWLYCLVFIKGLSLCPATEEGCAQRSGWNIRKILKFKPYLSKWYKTIIKSEKMLNGLCPMLFELHSVFTQPDVWILYSLVNGQKFHQTFLNTLCSPDSLREKAYKDLISFHLWTHPLWKRIDNNLWYSLKPISAFWNYLSV
jgi:hypothetical protein